MVTAAKIGHGTMLTWNVTTVAELTRIGPVDIVATKVDSTSLGSANFYKELLPGLLDPGDVEIEGLFRPDDTLGQIALLNDMNSRISRAFTITFPTVLSSATWTGTAYVTKFRAGDVTSEGIIPFSATISIVGKPALNVTASTGMATCTIVASAAPVPTLVPVFAIGTFLYATSVTNAITYVKLTPTAAGHTITIHNGFDDSSQTVASGAQSGELTLGLADTVTLITVTVQQATKSPKVYKLYVVKAA